MKSVIFKLYDGKIPVEKFKFYMESILQLNSPLISEISKEFTVSRLDLLFENSFEVVGENGNNELLALVMDSLSSKLKIIQKEGVSSKFYPKKSIKKHKKKKKKTLKIF